MRRLFCFIIVVWVFWLGRGVCHAEAQNLEVTGSVTLHSSDSPFYFKNIHIAPGGRLEILSNLTVFLDGAITNEGTLIVRGTELHPTLLTSVDRWQTIISTQTAAKVELQHVVISNFRESLKLEAASFVLHDIVLRDGIQNSIHIGTPGLTQSTVLDIARVTFQNFTTGTAMTENQLRIFGTYAKVMVDTIQFVPFRLLTPENRKEVLVHDGKTFNSIYSSLSSDGCRVTIIFADNNNRTTGTVADCVANDQVPVIFVPGYGTSLNISSLSKVFEKDTTSWSLSPLLTPSYFTFLEGIKKAGIPYEVAGYDWRLPASEISRRYLQPVIERVKQQYHVKTVNIVAHSFGGIVARSYVQGSGYKGDVLHLLEVGTPNFGAVKAYQVWEGAQLPTEWKILSKLIQYYKYLLGSNLDDIAVIHKAFPSLRQLLPIYPSLSRDGNEIPVDQWREANTDLLALTRDQSALFARTSVTTAYSVDNMTPHYMYAKPGGLTSWFDGEPIRTDNNSGDGTVVKESALLPQAIPFPIPGKHSELLNAASDLITYLYPAKKVSISPAETKEILWFSIDCPVTVTIITPTGNIISTDSQVPRTAEGEVYESPDLKWLLLPQIPGEYQVEIKALADTPIRIWLNDEPIQRFSLKKDQVKTLIYGGEIQQLPVGLTTSPNPTNPINWGKISISSPRLWKDIHAFSQLTNMPLTYTKKPLSPSLPPEESSRSIWRRGVASVVILGCLLMLWKLKPG